MSGRFSTDHGSWLVRLDVTTIRRIRACLGIDLFELIDNDDLASLGSDLAGMADVTWIAVAEQAEFRGVDRDAFIESISGDAIEAMAGAFAEAVMDFLPEVDQDAQAKQRKPATDEDREPFELLLCKLAAKIPIDPGPYTFRQLLEMAKTATSDRWDHTATSNYLLAMVHRNPKAAPTPYEKFHPYLTKKAKRGGITGAQLAELQSAFREHHTITLKPGEFLPGM